MIIKKEFIMKKVLILVLLILSCVFTGCTKSEIVISGDTKVEVGENILLTSTYVGNSEILWFSDDEEIAIVNSEGIVTGKKVGQVLIKLEVEGKTFSKSIEVVSNSVEITIRGVSSLKVGESSKFEAVLSKETTEKVVWHSEDNQIATVDEEGIVEGINEGHTKIVARILGKEASFEVEVTKKYEVLIKISGSNKVVINESTKLNITIEPADTKLDVMFISSDESIAVVDDTGVVTGKAIGNVIITVVSLEDENIKSTFEIIIIEPLPITIEIIGDKEMTQGSYNYLSLQFSDDKIATDVVWESSNPKVAIVHNGIVLSVNKGNVTITATSKVDSSIKGKIIISVTKYNPEVVDENVLATVNNIVNNMTLKQKIGQMFIVGFGGTEMSNSLQSAITTYNFGNVIYMGANVSNPSSILTMSNDIQSAMMNSNSVPGFICIDQEGGRVARITNGGTHFISNMAMGATGDVNNTYLEGQAMGQELKSYGINVDFAPVMDVNNNPNNPVIGVRSYSDNSLLVSLYGKNMYTGLLDSNVMGCAKHFPGHGNTATDSHYGLPTITTGLDELYQTELAPFISAVANGIDAIMTTHIIFTVIDEEYPATLSNKVLTGLLRNELGYDGLIISDGMEMAAVSKNFGGYDETAVLAIKAGVDMLTYTSLSNPITAYNGLLKAVEDNLITEERIDESVKRIILKKIKYGILDNYIINNTDISSMLEKNEALNLDFSKKSITKVQGNFSGLDKNKSILIVSPTSTYNLGAGLAVNSFANYAANYLSSNGYNKCSYLTISNNASSSESQNVLSKANECDTIVIALSNVTTNKYALSAELVNNLVKLNKELVIIALDSPYDLRSYSNCENIPYICVYGYQKASTIMLAKYLNGEFVATGVFPISIESLKNN